jgi:hypothetical protein
MKSIVLWTARRILRLLVDRTRKPTVAGEKTPFGNEPSGAWVTGSMVNEQVTGVQGTDHCGKPILSPVHPAEV